MSVGTAILGASAISAGSGVLGSFLGAGAEERAAEDALAFRAGQAGIARQDFENLRRLTRPFADIGTRAVGRLERSTQGDFDEFFASPGFNFRLGEGIRALDRSAAARGRLLSGAQLRGITEFGQGLASNEFSNFQNRLLDLTNIGLQGAGLEAGALAGQAGVAQGLGAAGGNDLLRAGLAQSQGFTGAASSINSATQAALLPILLQGLGGSSFGGSSGPSITRTGSRIF
ncbi:MAG: hypothetical protein ACR2QH_10525 [Geminicoccaceae bacterium]